MGCGSSAAALVAGVMLANHFGGLGWSDAEMLDEACRREGHPDNVAACMLGGMTVSAMHDGKVTAASFGQRLPWGLLVALPLASLPTSVARAMLPAMYSRADAVSNVQATALLVSAFALGRGDLLAAGTLDRLHQPYRAAACPLLERAAPSCGAGRCAFGDAERRRSVDFAAACGGANMVEVQTCGWRTAAGDADLECVATGIAAGAEFSAGSNTLAVTKE